MIDTEMNDKILAHFCLLKKCLSYAVTSKSVHTNTKNLESALQVHFLRTTSWLRDASKKFKSLTLYIFVDYILAVLNTSFVESTWKGLGFKYSNRIFSWVILDIPTRYYGIIWRFYLNQSIRENKLSLLRQV